MTQSQFLELISELPDVEEVPKKTETDFHRDGEHLVRIRKKGTVVAIRLPWKDIDLFQSSHPEIFFVTPHYVGSLYLLAKIEDIQHSLAKKLLEIAWENAAIQVPQRDSS